MFTSKYFYGSFNLSHNDKNKNKGNKRSRTGRKCEVYNIKNNYFHSL